ncbi:hypothetical protein [Zobellia galactanivorans]|uniref:hypothetical protein n=1 Tax=Zobellia galactanivorans (strain DSM 12802 / CCUG 47099 / CIP 106680 / NCIMB 13871 / Dsij) TaxID=63186 RepID=UPI001C0700A3|nr:hypothetical protein [Zobellia galactanivorans]MBU3028339.1 hypothetical protein [Zobellia galactanivorans]
MKYFKFLFLLCVVSVSAQNYNYALDEKPVPDPQHSEVIEAENLPEEKLYFDSYLLPLEDAYKLQEALDTYGSVRLEKGNYPGPRIVLKTGQRLFGHPTKTKIPSIIIRAGSKNVRVQNVDSKITFEAGAEISNCTIKNVKLTPLECKDCSLSDNLFINLDRCTLNWDCSGSGYFRNNRFIKHWIHVYSPQIVMKGNNATPSYGNVSVWLNLLTPGGHSAEIENLQSLTWIGMDAETWNLDGDSSKDALLTMRQMGRVNLVGMTGGTSSPHKIPVYDIEAETLSIFNQTITSNGGGKSIVQPKTDVFSVYNISEGYDMLDQNSGSNFDAFLNGDEVYLDRQLTSSKIVGSNEGKLENIILGSKYEPWPRGDFDKLPNPAGSNWEENRKNQLDQYEYIQDLVDKDGIAELEEGIYYIGKSIILKDGQGIIGQGTGKTAIIGLSDDFPLVIGEGASSSVDFTLTHMTLQGGSAGLQIRSSGNGLLQVTSCNFKFLVFRNQRNGIHLNKFYGFDNNFLDHVSFIDCNIGFYQEVDPSYTSGENATMMYVDKIVFYESQFINCGIGVSMMAGRTDNLIGWVNCKFDGNEIAADLKYHKGSFFANCDFVNQQGDYIIGESPIAVYSSIFKNNQAKGVFKSRNVIMEGSTLSDNIPFFTQDKPTQAFIANSTINGSLGRFDNGMLINTIVSGEGSSKSLLVQKNDKGQTILLDRSSVPYPQLLVKQ